MTRVLFVRNIEEPLKGDVMAIFVDDKYDESSSFITAYEFVGQHSAASWEFVRDKTIPTKSAIDCHGSLLKHLENVVGYTDLALVDWSDVPSLTYPVVNPADDNTNEAQCSLCRKITSAFVKTSDISAGREKIIEDSGLKGEVLCTDCAAKFKNITDEEACMEDL